MGLSVRSLFCFTVLCVLSSFAIISLGKKELDAFLTLPRGAMGWSVVCDCGFSRSYSLLSHIQF